MSIKNLTYLVIILSIAFLSACSKELPTPQATPIQSPPPTAVSPQADWLQHYPGLNPISAIVFRPDGRLWVSTQNGLLLWDLETNTYSRYTQQDGLPNNYNIDITLAPDGSLWLGSFYYGVVHINTEGITTYTTADGLGDDKVRFIAAGADGTIWTGTDTGLSRFQQGEWVIVERFDEQELTSLITGGSDVWITTAGGELSHYDSK